MKDNKIDMNSFYEILQDNISMVILEKILNGFKCIESKNAIEEFIADFSPVLIYEAYIFFKKKGLATKDNFYNNEKLRKKVEDYRMLTTKKRVPNSEYIHDIKENMGIDFKNDIFDINVVALDNVIRRFNFSEYNKIEERDFLGSCYLTNAEFSKITFKNLTVFSVDDYKNILNKIIEECMNDIKKLEVLLSGNRYSYRSSKLFLEADITEVDKYFILYRLNMIVILIELEKFFEKNNFTISANENIICDVHMFFSKIIALEIEILGNDIRNMNTNFSKSIQKKLDETLLKKNKNFYSLNRKLRNNIHYEKVDIIDEASYKELIKLQKEYLNIIYEEIKNKLHFNLDEEDILLSEFFKYCNDNNIEKDEIDRNYENYYTQYYYKKSIDRNF